MARAGDLAPAAAQERFQALLSMGVTPVPRRVSGNGPLPWRSSSDERSTIRLTSRSPTRKAATSSADERLVNAVAHHRAISDVARVNRAPARALWRLCRVGLGAQTLDGRFQLRIVLHRLLVCAHAGADEVGGLTGGGGHRRRGVRLRARLVGAP